MAYLIDTSVLARRADQTAAQHNAALLTLRQLVIDGETLCIVPQVLTELWSVFTRAAPPVGGGLGLTVADAETERVRLTDLFTLLPETAGIHQHWVQIVNRFAVTGRLVHDARLVAAMLEHDLSHVLTFNVSDFQRFTDAGIVVVEPQAL